MKKFKSFKVSGLNIAIYTFLVFLSVSALIFIWKFTNRIYLNPQEISHQSTTIIINPSNNVFVYLKEDVLKDDASLYQKLQRNKLIYDTIKRIVFITMLFLITIQLKTLLNSLKNKVFFIQENLNCVRKISYLLGTWVVINFILYQCFQFFIPFDLIQHNHNYIPINKDILFSLLFSIEYTKLLAAFAFYIISVVFKEGYYLKKQSDLTI